MKNVWEEDVHHVMMHPYMVSGEEGWASLEDPMEENLTEEEEFDTFDDWK